MLEGWSRSSLLHVVLYVVLKSLQNLWQDNEDEPSHNLCNQLRRPESIKNNRIIDGRQKPILEGSRQPLMVLTTVCDNFEAGSEG